MQRSPLTLIVISVVMCALGLWIALTSQSIGLRIFAGALSLLWAVAVIRQFRGGTPTPDADPPRQE